MKTEALIKQAYEAKRLSRQQVKTLTGQYRAGNSEGALRGLIKILSRGEQ